MSSAILEILDKDFNIIGFGEYHGTSDTVPREFVIDYEKEMKGQKPYFLGWGNEKCNHNGIDVILVSNYGGKSYWPSKVCIECKTIIGKVASPYEPETGYTLLPRDEQVFWKKWHEEGWPKSGDPREIIL